jgi:hypothetical protein
MTPALTAPCVAPPRRAVFNGRFRRWRRLARSYYDEIERGDLALGAGAWAPTPGFRDRA